MFRSAINEIPHILRNISKTTVKNTNNYATEATVDVKPFKLHRLDKGPETRVTVTRDEAQHLYTQMQTIRRLETSAGNLYKEKIIRGFCHLYSGQEACAVGMKSAMRPQDNIISAYRVHGWTYLMGVPPVGVLAELTGRQSGCARGKGGSMHMYAPNFYGGNGIVGAQVPLGAGIALACKYKGNGGVCLSLYGDGASNQGQVFEAYNMAYLWKLPAIFVCENNGYGMGTSSDRSSSNTDYYTRGDALPGIWVDGMDVLAVKSATDFAIDYVNKHGALVMEVFTYRYSGHSMSDPGTSYRSREEIQEVRQKRDPITSFKERILENELLTPDEIKAIDTKVRKEIDEATNIAKADKEIPLEELWTDVYANNLENFIRGTTSYSIKHRVLNKGPETSVKVSREEALVWYYQMQMIRRLELFSANLYTEKIIRGFCHLYSGQEACCVGMKAAMRKQDSIITAYRCHAWTYIMGRSPVEVLAELTGREKGCSRGKGGSMHMYAPNFYGGNGIVGAQVPLGNGIALASKYIEDCGVCVNIYGDGAANQGQVFESYNMAYLYKLPVIYVCENNQYGMGTSANRAAMNTNFYTRGDMIPGIWVDGMDILAVKSATEFAIEYVLTCTPIILELNTYRYYGHSMSDPGVSYRTRDEINEVRKQRDPITSFREVILNNQLATEDELKTIESNAKEEIDKAGEISKADKEIPLDEICADIYSKNLEPAIRSTLGYTMKHKEIAKRSDQPVIPPKEKPNFEGYAFAAKKDEKKADETEKKDEKKTDETEKKDEKKAEQKGEKKGQDDKNEDEKKDGKKEEK